MLFALVRIIFWGIVFTVCFTWIKKSRVIHKRPLVLSLCIITVLFTTLSALVPIENFFAFPSPESAYHYSHFGDVQLVVEGEKTDFVIGKQGDTDIYAMIPKVDTGWKLGMGRDMKRVRRTVTDEMVIYVYQYKNSCDYYISLLGTDGGTLEPADNRDSEFHYLKKFNPALNQWFYTYYAHVKNLDSLYTITVNGEAVTLC